MEGHLWSNKENWAYKTYPSQGELEEKYEQLLLKLMPLIDQGLCAAVYTQLTDVEGELNGLLTYDRAIAKFDETTLSALHGALLNAEKIRHKVTVNNE